MKKMISIIIVVIICMLISACGDKDTATETKTSTTTITTTVTTTTAATTKTESAAQLKIYFGGLGKLKSIPTYESYLESQSHPYESDFMGTNHLGDNDSRRFYFYEKIKKVVAEYPNNGDLLKRDLDVEKIQDDLYRVDPYFRIYDEDWVDGYVTFYIYTKEGTYYMTWISKKK